MINWKDKIYTNYSSLTESEFSSKKTDCLLYEKYFIRFLPENKESRIVDLACGKGLLVKCIQNAGYINVSGVDISEDQIKIALSNGINGVENADMFEFLKKESQKYDVIILSDILEHLNTENFFELFELISKKISEKGVVIMQIPNAASPIAMRIRYGDLTHETCFTETSIRQGLKNFGFKNIKIYEITPVSASIKGIIRKILWKVVIFPFRLLYYIETGRRNMVLSQNMIVTARF